MTDEALIILYRVLGVYHFGLACVFGLVGDRLMLGICSVLSGGMFALAVIDHEWVTHNRKHGGVG